MREILFRGKIKDDGDWEEGSLVVFTDYDAGSKEYWIVHPGQTVDFRDDREYEVVPETVGQYTGLTDKNGEKIFEGDVVKVRQERCDGIGVIGYENGSFMIYVTSGNIYERTLFEYWYNDWDIEIVGNIHDNPELLKED